MLRRTVPLLLLVVSLGGPAEGREEPAPPPGWPAAAWQAQSAWESVLRAVPSAAELASWHEQCCREVHPAGSAGERRLADRLEAAMKGMGLETERQALGVLLPVHEDAYVEVFEGRHRHMLRLHEDLVPEDPSVAEHVPPAFNAYSGSGMATGEVVYANYGTREDFAKLAELGVDCKGRIVIARYGRNFRGFKAKYAEQAGAAGVLLYTDPADSGYGKGLPYPEGGYANPSSIQRGSIKTLPYPGDPRTPFAPSLPGLEGAPESGLGLPTIPVQPIGWRAAQRILEPMRGAEVPAGWQGGLPFRYRLTGGADLRVQIMVKQPRRVLATANVLGILRGAQHPDEMVVVGCHYDAWTFGAGDPHAGTIVLLEMARSFARAAAEGRRPARTIVFAHWGAEEMGIIGSTEWCEANAQALEAHGVAYVNLDMAAMGPEFRSAAAPALKSVIEQAAGAVPQAREPARSVHAAWTARGKGEPRFGNLGGGSDHVGFYCHLGVPSCSLGGGGSRGVSYHSAYDTLAWYRKVVGDYEPALMLARLGNVLVARLANAPLVPYDLVRPLADMRGHLDGLLAGASTGEDDVAAGLRGRLARLEAQARAAQDALGAAAASGRLDAETGRRLNEVLIASERAWIAKSPFMVDGLPGRPWYRNLYAASDPHSGYAAWMLPLLRHALETKEPGPLARALAAYGAVLDRLSLHYAELMRLLGD